MSFLRKIVHSKTKENEKFYCDLKSLLNFKPVVLKHYKKAFIHKSLKMIDSNGKPVNYERLEFLGDAILGSVIASFLYKEVPKGNEGYLTQMRSKVVNRENLNKLGKELDLIRFVKSGINQNQIGENIHGNIFESLIGAIYLDRGYNYCHQFIYDQVIIPYIDLQKLENKISSYKGFIIEWCQKTGRKYVFENYEDTKTPFQKHFSVRVIIDGHKIAKGRALSKKRAEEMAAKRVYYIFQNQIINS